MIECVDCEEYLREIDRLESRLAAALDALRRSDELLSWITFDDGVPNVWPEESVISACRTYNAAALAGGGK